MKYFDANTWSGAWPFSFQPAFDARSLAEHLSGHGIDRALVSPVDAVFKPEPGPANAALLRGTSGIDSLVPVPVVNPTLGNWRDLLESAAADPRVRAIRILPAYHGYSLRHRSIDTMLDAMLALKLRLVVTIRLIDERHEYFAMNIKGVPSGHLAALLGRHPDIPVLASGLARPDLLELVPAHPNLLADLSFAEWHDTVEHLLGTVADRQIAFASHTPFLVTEAATAKIACSRVSAETRRRISMENLERFLAP